MGGVSFGRPYSLSNLLIDEALRGWLMEDVGRGDRTTSSLALDGIPGAAQWCCKSEGVVAGLSVAARVFHILSTDTSFVPLVHDGTGCDRHQVIAEIEGSLEVLLVGERVALNLAMHLSGIATLTRQYVEKISDLPAQLVDTRKTIPGLRLLEKYATHVGGALNHRMGLDDAVMIKDNHIAAVGSIGEAIARVRAHAPYPLSIEVETESLEQVAEAIEHRADIIMLDNMALEEMQQAVAMIRAASDRTKIEASGNVTLQTIRAVAETGVDYVSSSAPITQSSWLDLSMRIANPH